MPRRIIQHPDHDRRKALWIAVWWIETFTVHGRGDVRGEPTVLVDEYADFVVDCYTVAKTVNGNAHRLYDSAFFSRPKGCDKSGIAAKIALFEAFGPCRFAGYAKGGETYEFLGQTYTYAKGEAMGKAVNAPHVRVMATEEGQTGNVYDTIYFNLTDDTAPLSALRAYGCDPGLTRVMLPNGGEITPSTSGAASKDGGLETFVVFDESHLYNTPQLRDMYGTVTRNLRKRKGTAGTWFIETTTMYQPGQESIAEETYRLADQIQEKLADKSGRKYKRLRVKIFFDHRWGEVEKLEDEDALRQAIIEAFGDALAWNSLEGIIDGIYDTRQSEADSRRYFLNALTAAQNAWVTPELLAKVVEQSKRADFEPLKPGDTITLGFDGSKSDDATALIGCRVSDRYIFVIRIEEVPDGPEAEGWQVDREAFDAAVSDTFSTYDVVGFYADPPHWQDYVDAWAREFADQLRVHASGRHSIEWWTNRDVPMSNALERIHDAMSDAGGPKVALQDHGVLKRHVANARVWKRRAGSLIGKDRRGSSHKIDAAMAMTLAHEAAADYAAKPKPKRPSSFVPVRVR